MRLNHDPGDALWEIGGLSRLASERCATARCAIRTMGERAHRFPSSLPRL